MPDATHVLPGSIDSHCHITHIAERGIDTPALMRDLHERGIAAVVDVGLLPSDLQERSSGLAEFPWIHLSSGIHPSMTEDLGETSCRTEAMLLLERQTAAGEVVAVGEIGLDYHWDTGERSVALELFEAQVELAVRHDLPVIVHNRDADEDVVRVLAAHKPRGVMHCFSGTVPFCRRCLDLGLSISLAGNVTFKKSIELRKVAAFVPPDRILVETDAPYLSPEPLRGRVNHPGHLGFTISSIARARGESEESVAASTADNARRLFGM